MIRFIHPLNFTTIYYSKLKDEFYWTQSKKWYSSWSEMFDDYFNH